MSVYANWLNGETAMGVPCCKKGNSFPNGFCLDKTLWKVSHELKDS